MILADEITCEIADPNAAKVELINCSTSLMDSAKGIELIWIAAAAIGSIGAMIVTLFMARYAWKAWQSSQEQIQIARDQMVQNQEIAVESLRIPSTIEFTRTLGSISGHLNFWSVSREEFTRLIKQLDATFSQWELFHVDVFRDGRMSDLIAKLQYRLEEYAEKWAEHPLPVNSWPEGQRSEDIEKLQDATSMLEDICRRLLNNDIAQDKFNEVVAKLNKEFPWPIEETDH